MLRWTLKGIGWLVASAGLMACMLWLGGPTSEHGGSEPGQARLALAVRGGRP